MLWARTGPLADLLNWRRFQKNAHPHIGIARPALGRAIAETDCGIHALQGFDHVAYAVIDAFELGMASVEESLERLKRDRVDILMVHEPDRPRMYDWWTDEEYNGPVLEVLDELKKEGLVDYIGLGSTTAYHIEPIIRTGRFDILLTALNYSLLWREAAHCALPAAHEHNMGIVIGSTRSPLWCPSDLAKNPSSCR